MKILHKVLDTETSRCLSTGDSGGQSSNHPNQMQHITNCHVWCNGFQVDINQSGTNECVLLVHVPVKTLLTVYSVYD